MEDAPRAGSPESLALEWSLFAYSSIITLLITLTPFRFRWPATIQYILVGPWFDIFANVLLFVPPGFLYWLTRRPGAGTRSSHVFWLGFAISSCIEFTQIFEPGRYASPSDVVSNACGAWLGAWLCERALRLLSRRWIGRLGLDLPLMNIVYLLIPLIWIDGLSAGSDSHRSYLTWILGFCGCVVIAGVYRFGLKPKTLNFKALGIIAAGWFLAGSSPTFLNLGLMPLIGCLLCGVLVCVLSFLPVYGRSNERRFELRVLRRVWPFYALYLVLLFLWPLPSAWGHWRGGLGFLEMSDDPPIVAVLQLLEHFTAFTLLGYMVAESHGRREISPQQSIVRTCLWCGLVALCLQVARGFHPGHAFSVAAGALMLVGSGCGGWIYWRQLSRIQELYGFAVESQQVPTVATDESHNSIAS
jgi:VanZ family protein